MLGIRFWGLGFKVQVLEIIRFWGLGFRVQVLGFRI